MPPRTPLTPEQKAARQDRCINDSQSAFMKGVVFSSVGLSATTLGLNSIWPAFQRLSWRPKLAAVCMGTIGISYWHAENTLLACQFERGHYAAPRPTRPVSTTSAANTAATEINATQTPAASKQ